MVMDMFFDKKIPEYLRTSFGPKAGNIDGLQEAGFRIPKTFFALLLSGQQEGPKALSETIVFHGKKEQISSLIIRSSQINEDGHTFSMAGQGLSIPNLPLDANTIENALRKLVETSGTRSVALIIQEYIHTESLYVSFSVNPNYDSPFSMLCERYEVNNDTLTIGKLISQESAKVDDPVSRKLDWVDLAMSLQLHYGYPVDVEWVYVKQKPMILQVRPITRIMYPVKSLWTNANFREGGIGGHLVSELSWSVYSASFTEAITTYFSEMGILPKNVPERWISRFMGYAYWNIGAIKEGAKLLPGFVEEEFDDTYGLEKRYSGRGFVTQFSLGRLFRGLKTAFALRKSFDSRLADTPALQEKWEQDLSYYTASFNDFSSVEEMQNFIQNHLFPLYQDYWRLVYDTSMYYNLYKSKFKVRVIQDMQVLNLSHTKVLRAIDDLFLNCFSKQELTYFNEKSSEKLYQMYNEDTDFPYKHRFAEILEHYKYMSSNDIELSVACWDEDALPFFVLIKERLEHITETPGFVNKREALFTKPSRYVENLKRLIEHKESFRDFTNRGHYILRKFALAVGDAYVQKDYLASIQQIFTLSYQDVIQKKNRKNWKNKAFGQEYLAEALRNFKPPNEIYLSSISGEEEKVKKPHSGEVIRGLGVSSGIVQGKAVWCNINALEEVNHDAIAIVDWVDTNNVKYLLRFKGVVSRYGGVLSHGAIVCREYGIPSVFNVLDSIDEIQEGMLISIDGRTGHIKMGKQ